MINILGDSFVDNKHNYKHSFFNQVLEHFDEEYINLGKEGTGPLYTMTKFEELVNKRGYDNLNGDKFIIILSNPNRETKNKNADVEVSLKNLMYLKGLSSYVIPDCKFFINNSITKLNYDLNNLNSSNFYFFDTTFDSISRNEFKDTRYMDCDTELNRFTYPDGKVKLLRDDRPNHFSRNNHNVISNIIITFFETGLHIKDKVFNDFLTEDSEYIYE